MDKEIVLITGSSGGVGAELAKKLLLEGCFVVGIDKIGSVIDSKMYKHIICDLKDRNSIKTIENELDKIVPTKLVCCVAITNNTDAESPDVDKVNDLFMINLISPWVIAASLLKRALGAGKTLKSVVFISSVHAYATSEGLAAYATSKAGLCGLTRSLAIDYAKHLTRVNAIAFGAIRTKMLTGLTDDEIIELEKRLLVKKIPSPDKVVGTIQHLLSDDASYVTGQTFIVDGGALSMLSTEA